MRIILFAGKGGVGKTSVAAATGTRTAALGYRTLVMSLDTAHSLADSFDLDRPLMDRSRGLPVRVAKGLEIQEVDVQEEVQRNWGQVKAYVSKLADEVARVDAGIAESIRGIDVSDLRVAEQTLSALEEKLIAKLKFIVVGIAGLVGALRKRIFRRSRQTADEF